MLKVKNPAVTFTYSAKKDYGLLDYFTDLSEEYVPGMLRSKEETIAAVEFARSV